MRTGFVTLFFTTYQFSSNVFIFLNEIFFCLKYFSQRAEISVKEYYFLIYSFTYFSALSMLKACENDFTVKYIILFINIFFLFFFPEGSWGAVLFCHLRKVDVLLMFVYLYFSKLKEYTATFKFKRHRKANEHGTNSVVEISCSAPGKQNKCIIYSIRT